jgi:hypothetical protein
MTSPPMAKRVACAVFKTKIFAARHNHTANPRELYITAPQES